MIEDMPLWEELFKLSLSGAAANPHSLSGPAVLRAEQMATDAYNIIQVRRQLFLSKSYRIKTNKGWLVTWGPRNDEGEIPTFVCGSENEAFVFDNQDSATTVVGSLNACYEPVIKEVK